MEKSNHPKRTINKHALGELVLFGSVDRVKALHAETTEAVKRLKLRLRRVAPLKRAPRGVGTFPSILDVKGWLDGLTREDPDVAFLKEVHIALKNRLDG